MKLLLSLLVEVEVCDKLKWRLFYQLLCILIIMVFGFLFFHIKNDIDFCSSQILDLYNEIYWMVMLIWLSSHCKPNKTNSSKFAWKRVGCTQETTQKFYLDSETIESSFGLFTIRVRGCLPNSYWVSVVRSEIHILVTLSCYIFDFENGLLPCW